MTPTGTDTTTPTFTPTYTDSATPSPSLTTSPTYTVSPTSTVSPTISPTPINSETPAAVEVTIKIFDASGELVVEIPAQNRSEEVQLISMSEGVLSPDGDGEADISEILLQGTNVVLALWDGRDSQGKVVRAGQYRIVVESQLPNGQTVIATTDVIVTPVIAAFIQSFTVLPNPARDTVTLSAQGLGSGTFFVRIYNISGEQVWRSHVTGTNMNLVWDLRTPGGSKTASGIYIVVMDFEVDGVTQRIIRRLGVMR